jgi:hypothetical protein
MQTDLTCNREVIRRLARWFYLIAGALAVNFFFVMPPGWSKAAPPGVGLPEKRDDGQKSLRCTPLVSAPDLPAERFARNVEPGEMPRRAAMRKSSGG